MIPSDYGKSNEANGNDPGNLHHIMSDYGTMNLKDLIKYEYTYVGQTTRRSQDDLSLFE